MAFSLPFQTISPKILLDLKANRINQIFVVNFNYNKVFLFIFQSILTILSLIKPKNLLKFCQSLYNFKL